MKIIKMTLLKLDKNQQKERENVNTTDLALTYILLYFKKKKSTQAVHIARGG